MIVSEAELRAGEGLCGRERVWIKRGGIRGSRLQLLRTTTLFPFPWTQYTVETSNCACSNLKIYV
jgi:hypothetical protein